MTDNLSPADVEAVARGLTDAQRTAIRRARPFRHDHRCRMLIPTYRDGGRLARSLVDLGMVEQVFEGFALTALGRTVHDLLAVRQHLQENR